MKYCARFLSVLMVVMLVMCACLCNAVMAENADAPQDVPVDASAEAQEARGNVYIIVCNSSANDIVDSEARMEYISVFSGMLTWMTADTANVHVMGIFGDDYRCTAEGEDAFAAGVVAVAGIPDVKDDNMSGSFRKQLVAVTDECAAGDTVIVFMDRSIKDSSKESDKIEANVNDKQLNVVLVSFDAKESCFKVDAEEGLVTEKLIKLDDTFNVFEEAMVFAGDVAEDHGADYLKTAAYPFAAETAGDVSMDLTNSMYNDVLVVHSFSGDVMMATDDAEQTDMAEVEDAPIDTESEETEAIEEDTESAETETTEEVTEVAKVNESAAPVIFAGGYVVTEAKQGEVYTANVCAAEAGVALACNETLMLYRKCDVSIAGIETEISYRKNNEAVIAAPVIMLDGAAADDYTNWDVEFTVTGADGNGTIVSADDGDIVIPADVLADAGVYELTVKAVYAYDDSVKAETSATINVANDAPVAAAPAEVSFDYLDAPEAPASFVVLPEAAEWFTDENDDHLTVKLSINGVDYEFNDGFVIEGYNGTGETVTAYVWAEDEEKAVSAKVEVDLTLCSFPAWVDGCVFGVAKAPAETYEKGGAYDIAYALTPAEGAMSVEDVEKLDGFDAWQQMLTFNAAIDGEVVEFTEADFVWSFSGVNGIETGDVSANASVELKAADGTQLYNAEDASISWSVVNKPVELSAEGRKDQILLDQYTPDGEVPYVIDINVSDYLVTETGDVIEFTVESIVNSDTGAKYAIVQDKDEGRYYIGVSAADDGGSKTEPVALYETWSHGSEQDYSVQFRFNETGRYLITVIVTDGEMDEPVKLTFSQNIELTEAQKRMQEIKDLWNSYWFIPVGLLVIIAAVVTMLIMRPAFSGNITVNVYNNASEGTAAYVGSAVNLRRWKKKPVQFREILVNAGLPPLSIFGGDVQRNMVIRPTKTGIVITNKTGNFSFIDNPGAKATLTGSNNTVRCQVDKSEMVVEFTYASSGDNA